MPHTALSMVVVDLLARAHLSSVASLGLGVVIVWVRQGLPLNGWGRAHAWRYRIERTIDHRGLRARTRGQIEKTVAGIRFFRPAWRVAVVSQLVGGVLL